MTYNDDIAASNSKIWILIESLHERGLPADTISELIRELITRNELDKSIELEEGPY